MFQPLSIDGIQAPSSEFSPGPAPHLHWIEIHLLTVDHSYQREIGRRGLANVRRIAEGFDWSKFAPVIVAPVEGGQYAIVDGQHRTTAAMLRNIEKVPCQVVLADRAKQAQAFAAVNGQVTLITAQQMFHARLAAGDPESVRLKAVCDAADVIISRKNLEHRRTKPGQTQAVGALRRCLEKYGPETLITALQCITRTGDGNAGWIRATIIDALCKVLNDNPHWRESGGFLLDAMDDFDFADAWEDAMASRNFVLAPAVELLIATKISGHLEVKWPHRQQRNNRVGARAYSSGPEVDTGSTASASL